jgi:hypothetical protein
MNGKRDNIGIHEDEICNRDGCEGKLQFERGGDGDCSCHISPPCGNCVRSVLTCTGCGAEPEYED